MVEDLGVAFVDVGIAICGRDVINQVFEAETSKRLERRPEFVVVEIPKDDNVSLGIELEQLGNGVRDHLDLECPLLL